MLLGVTPALLLAMTMAAGADLLRGRPRRWAVRAAPWAAEAAILLVAYAAWQQGLGVIADHTRGAVAHGTAVWRLEQFLHLPTEASVQRWFVPMAPVMRGLNYYYAVGHVQDVIAVLVWSFWRHRDGYPAARRALVWTIGLCAVVQAYPVAPPRLLPVTGVIDGGRLVGYALYPLGGLRDSSQLTAMPSVHVAMALWATVTVVSLSRSPWRWLLLVHLVVTVAAVIVPGYHFWLDGAVAAGLLAVVLMQMSADLPIIARLRARPYLRELMWPFRRGTDTVDDTPRGGAVR
ncbi:MAG: phosphatase PAP2 family protein [Acidimicrobiales bacterium]